ncbi:unnamed protein product [Paramecium octaurelia]|uniref:Uncharacterized protein n=1 Tax=Paramecium octaurelia TaxID=43137 RepID=A0A8S1YQK2_PAROT|nr:unnamed protein product [Paramecium octaurelia]
MKKGWICQQAITDHQHQVYELSLNEIKLFHVDKINQSQQLTTQNRINNGLQYKQFMVIVLDEQSQLIVHSSFCKGDDGNLFFPQQYIKSKQLLVSKKDNYINLISKIDNYQFKVEQSIQFGICYLCSSVMWTAFDYLG